MGTGSGQRLENTGLWGPGPLPTQPGDPGRPVTTAGAGCRPADPMAAGRGRRPGGRKQHHGRVVDWRRPGLGLGVENE
jgi:hypothetical protein